MQTLTNRPTLDVDPFSSAVLANRLACDESIREAGPVVWIPKYSFWAVGGDSEARKVFADWKRFPSSMGTGLVNVKRQQNWRRPSVILDSDPPQHTPGRKVLSRVLSPAAINGLRTDFQALADRMVDDLVEQRCFDAHNALAFAFPFKALPDAVGMQPDGREHLMPYATLNFNAMGPRNELYDAALMAAEGSYEFVQWQCRRENLTPDGFGAQIYAAVDTGEITEDAAGLLVRAFLSAGIDTTVYGIGLAIDALINHPEQWDMLHAQPERARAAFEETLRFTPASPIIGRTTRDAIEFAGVSLGAEEKVMMFLGAANRDPRRWEDPHRFDITRSVSGHLSFGVGIHVCVGQMVARLEAECVLSALARRVKRIERTATPTPLQNNWLRGYTALPVEVTPV